MVQFLKNFYAVFPEYNQMDVGVSHQLSLLSAETRTQTYFGGESFAGQYIPYFGGVDRISERSI